jgi:hypothetical protein
MLTTLSSAAAVLVLLTGMSMAIAAPNIPSSDLPGRERQRFQDTPLDRYTDPLANPQRTEPLWQRQCDYRTPRRKAKQHARSRNQPC